MHRTGTTLFQEFMYIRRTAAAKQKTKFIEIDECRNQGFLAGITHSIGAARRSDLRLRAELENYTSKGWRVVLSDENISGSMEDCVLAHTLYPNFSAKMGRLGASIELFDTVYISIRSEDEWWLSCLAFLRQRGFQVFDFDKLTTAIMESSRTWVNLIDDVIEVFPNSKIVVRDFNYHVANPKRQMKDVTGWSEIKAIRNISAKKSNGSSSGKKILFSRQDEHLFSKEQTANLQKRYASDLDQIAQTLKASGRGRLLMDRPS
jgi:hypothetical protein